MPGWCWAQLPRDLCSILEWRCLAHYCRWKWFFCHAMETRQRIIWITDMNTKSTKRRTIFEM